MSKNKTSDVPLSLKLKVTPKQSHPAPLRTSTNSSTPSKSLRAAAVVDELLSSWNTVQENDASGDSDGLNAAQANDDNDDDNDDDDDEQDDEVSQKSCNNSMNPDNEGVDANGIAGSGNSKKARVSRKKNPANNPSCSGGIGSSQSGGNVSPHGGSSPMIPLSAVDYNFLSEFEKHDMLHGESSPAESYFAEFPELVFPNSHSRSGNLDRCLVSNLKVGFVLPILDFKLKTPSFEHYAGALAYYVVVSVNELDGFIDLYRVAEYRRNADKSVFASPQWLTFSPPQNSIPRTVIVVSHLIASTNKLPLGVRLALKDNFSLTAKGPTVTAITSSSTSNMSDKSRAAELRELAAAPLMRALHFDSASFARLVGPTSDVRDKSFLFSLRNRYSSSILQSLPIVQNVDHLELFVTFKWSRELSMTSKKAECCHLQLFKPADVAGNVTPFLSLIEIMDALQMLEQSCVDFFLDEKHMGFFGQVFYALHRKLQSREIDSCISALPVDFIVYKISQLLIDWADLYGHPNTRFLNRDTFLELNIATLNFDPIAWRQEATNIPIDLLPKQFGTMRSPVSSTFKRGNNNKKRLLSRPSSSSEGLPHKKPASAETLKGTSSKKSGPKIVAAAVSGSSTTAASSQPPSGKYICVADFIHKQRPGDFQPCRLGADCTKRHIPKPASGSFAPKDKAELLTSIRGLNHVSMDRKAELTAVIQAVA